MLIPLKKIAALLLTALMLFSLLGCVAPGQQVLRVAMSPDFAPMEFVVTDSDGNVQFAGFDVTLANYLANGLGRKLEIVPMSFDACQEAVARGEVDLAISGFSWLPDRAERFNLSVTYHAGDLSANQVLLTTRENANRFDDAQSLRGIRVGAQSASLQEWLIGQQLPDAVSVAFTDITQAVDQLRQGAFDAIALAEGNADAIIAANPDLCKSGFCFELTEELRDNLILLKKGNDELTEAVNTLLASAEEAGYYARWYAEALEMAGIGVEVHYDDQGHIATEG